MCLCAGDLLGYLEHEADHRTTGGQAGGWLLHTLFTCVTPLQERDEVTFLTLRSIDEVFKWKKICLHTETDFFSALFFRFVRRRIIRTETGKSSYVYEEFNLRWSDMEKLSELRWYINPNIYSGLMLLLPLRTSTYNWCAVIINTTPFTWSCQPKRKTFFVSSF